MKPILLALPSFALVSGCMDHSSTADQAAALAPACQVDGTRTDPSLVVTDAGVLSRFSFERTVKQVLASVPASPSETPTQLYQQWMSTFGPTDCTNPKVNPEHYDMKCPRTPEFELASVDPFDPNSGTEFVPVALTNRFDLAPTSGANCGEYRIVYAMKSSKILGRGFYIFEGAMPNPNPALGLTGCLPIAEFWQSLSVVPSTQSLADKLEQFYYLGTAIPGVPAVVDARHYGLYTNGAYTAGQMRSNMFINGVQWHLREFKPDLVCDGTTSAPSCTLMIDHVSTKTNPARELFDGTASLAPQFVQDFPSNVKALAAGDLNAIGMTISNDLYNTYESVSELNTDVLYDQHADTTIESAIQAQIPPGSTLTVQDILRRASTQTCGGCHQLSTVGNEAQLGGGLVWPQSLGFVQIDEQSHLSPALTDVFLPHRLEVLDDFIASHCGSTGADEDDGLTVGGSQVGAPN
ncbi:MAG TPA: hypothetical protein VLX92_19185 [Kofleriaceae bacterium]|nr:hypothetical protein [Kofleriaceae bacterium]